MEVATNYMPGDHRLVDRIVYELKSQGIFDQFRKECIADVDTKPAYQNLRQRVEGSVTSFLQQQVWKPDMNKNQVREMLRKHIQESGFLETGVERIVDQVVNPKINTVLLPQVEDVVYRFLGIAKPNRLDVKKEPIKINIPPEDLLPTDLEAVSPESIPTDKKEDSTFDDSLNLDVTDMTSDITETTHNLKNSKMDEDESPPFELIDEKLPFVPREENSVDSHLSGFSGLASHESNSIDNKNVQMELSNQDSQVSQNSSESRLSIITSDENTKMEICSEPDAKTSQNGEDIKNKVELVKEVGIENVTSTDLLKKQDSISKTSDDKKCRGSDKQKSRSDKAHKDDKSSRSNGKDSGRDKDKSRYSSSKDKDRGKDKRDVKSSSSSKSKSDKGRVDSSEDKDKYKNDKNKEKSDRSKEGGSRDKERNDKDKDKSEKDRDKNRSSRKYSSSSKDKSSSSSSKRESSSKDKDKSHSSSNSSKDRSKSIHSDSKSRDDYKSKSSSSDKYKKDEKSSSKSTSSTSKRDRDKKRDSKRDSKDDHYSLKDKKTDRRSTDRDSNDGQSSKQSNSSSLGEGNSSQSQKHGQRLNGSNSGTGSGDSGNSDALENEHIVNISECLEQKEIVLISQDENIKISDIQKVKLYKPKFASNIHEARKLMKIRKQLAILEKQNQLSLARVEISTTSASTTPLKSSNKHSPADKMEKSRENAKKKPNILKKSPKVPEKIVQHVDNAPLVLNNSILSKENWDALEKKLYEEMSNKYNSYESPDDEECGYIYEMKLGEFQSQKNVQSKNEMMPQDSFKSPDQTNSRKSVDQNFSDSTTEVIRNSQKIKEKLMVEPNRSEIDVSLIQNSNKEVRDAENNGSIGEGVTDTAEHIECTLVIEEDVTEEIDVLEETVIDESIEEMDSMIETERTLEEESQIEESYDANTPIEEMGIENVQIVPVIEENYSQQVIILTEEQELKEDEILQISLGHDRQVNEERDSQQISLEIDEQGIVEEGEKQVDLETYEQEISNDMLQVVQDILEQVVNKEESENKIPEIIEAPKVDVKEEPNDICRYLENNDKTDEKFIEYIEYFIKKLEESIIYHNVNDKHIGGVRNDVKNGSKKNNSVNKRGVKRKLEQHLDVKNNNKKEIIEECAGPKRGRRSEPVKPLVTRNAKERISINTDLTPVVNFSLPLSPAESDQSAGKKEGTPEIVAKPKRNSLNRSVTEVAGKKQRYSSDDLYKPRPIFSSRRRNAKNQDN